MWNKTGRRQRTWGNIARHRDHRERDGEGDLCPDDKAARRRGAETPTSLCREAQQQAKRTWARGDKGSHQSSHCGWEPPETAGRRARDTPKWLQGSTLKVKPALVPHLKQNQLWLHFTCLCWLRSGKHRRWKKQSRKDPGVLGRQELISAMENLPGGPVVKIPCSQFRGCGFAPWSGN